MEHTADNGSAPDFRHTAPPKPLCGWGMEETLGLCQIGVSLPILHSFLSVGGVRHYSTSGEKETGVGPSLGGP